MFVFEAIAQDTTSSIASEKSPVDFITKDSILKAERLSNYFIANYEKMVIINASIAETNKTFKDTKGSLVDKLKAILKQNPDFNKSQIAKILNISRVTLYKYLKQIDGEK